MGAAQDYAKWFEGNLSSLLAGKDQEKIVRLGAKMKEIGLLFKEANLNGGVTRADCDSSAGDSGDCKEYSCLAGGSGGDCDSNSCINDSGGGACGSSVCDSCASKV